MNDKINHQLLEAKQCIGCMHEGLIVTSAEGTIIDISPAAERILEAPSTTLRGTQIRELCHLPGCYEELVRHTDSEGRNLNRSIIVLAGGQKRKIVNMSIQRVGQGPAMRYVHVF